MPALYVLRLERAGRCCEATLFNVSGMCSSIREGILRVSLAHPYQHNPDVFVGQRDFNVGVFLREGKNRGRCDLVKRAACHRQPVSGAVTWMSLAAGKVAGFTRESR